MIPYGKHDISQQDIDAVVDVLKNQFLTQGSRVPEFESALTDTCQSRYAVAVNSGTSALHIACLALGVSAGDLVWTSPISFVASANCALYCGADIDFVDIDPSTRNMSVSALEAKLEIAQIAGRLPKAIVVVHFAGMSCDMEAIRQLTHPLGIKLIEDASHALGGVYKDKPVGSCQYSDLSVLSFHPVKGVTTAEGGAVTTNDLQLYQKLSLFGKHGVTRDVNLMEAGFDELLSDSPWYYQQIELGFNFRLSDLHAALGGSQLKRLSDFIQCRKRLVAQYRQKLEGLPLKLPEVNEDSTSAWHLFVVELVSHDRQAVFNQLRQKGIGVNVHYIPIHLQPYYRKLGFKPGDFPQAESYYKMALTLPLYPTLSDDEQNSVISALKEVLS